MVVSHSFMTSMAPRRLLKLGIAGRPVSSSWSSYIGGNPTIIGREDLPDLHDLFDVAKNCNAVSKSIQALRDYIFLEGLEWLPKYSKKCTQCGHEFPRKARPDFCSKCKNQTLYTTDGQEILWYSEPDEEKTKLLDEFFKKVDKNNHTLLELLKMYEWNINVADDAFIVIAQDYGLTQEGDIRTATVKEMWVPDPINFKMIQDPSTHLPGGLLWICLNEDCRPGLKRDERTGKMMKVGREYKMPGKCQVCGMKLHDVWYVSHEPGSKDHVIQYYLEREVIHNSKYGLSYGYGYSQIIPIYNMARTLMKMEEYTKTFYDEERTPRMAIFIPTRNPDSLREAFETAEDRNVSQGGHYVPKFMYDPGERAGVGVQVEEFSKLPDELKLIENRDEYYRRIGAAFDVAPVFQGNVEAAGMQVQGPTQFAVTKLGAQKASYIYNNKVFPKLLKLLGVADQWELSVKLPEEADQIQKIQVRIAEAQEALLLSQLGFAPTGRDHEGRFEYKEKPSLPQGMPMMGQMGGMGMGAGGGGMGNLSARSQAPKDQMQVPEGGM